MTKIYKKGKTQKKGKKTKGGKCKCNSFFGGKKSRKNNRKSRKRLMKGGNSYFNNPIGGNVTTSGAIADANIMGGNMDSRTGLYNAGDSNDFVV